MSSWKSLLGGDRRESAVVYFVCTGNICRSAFAKEYAKRLPGTVREFDSAGVGAVVGAGMDATMLEAASEFGVESSDHVARQLTGRMLKDSVLVIVFDRSHMDWLTREFPEYLDKVFAIGHLARVLGELPQGSRVEPERLGSVMRAKELDERNDWVSDPYKQGPEAARASVEEIAAAIDTIAPVLF